MRRSFLLAPSPSSNMGSASSYHPGWVYHGLAIGPLRDAALRLDRLMTGALLPPELLDPMGDAHPIGGPSPGRPWNTPGYGLGLMVGIASADTRSWATPAPAPGASSPSITSVRPRRG
jgi:hypothetical protein